MSAAGATTNVDEFTLGLRDFGARVVPSIVAAETRRVALTVYGECIRLTPVDTGFLRFAWEISINQPSATVPARTEAGSYQADTSAAASAIAALEPFDDVWICNNLPYAVVVDEGGYPNPVKRGSWDKTLKAFVIKSEGGYSKRAPAGMSALALEAGRLEAEAA